MSIWVRLAISLLRLGAMLAVLFREVMQGGVPTQPGDEGHRLVKALTAADQREGRIRAIADQDQFPFWLPTAHFADHQCRPLDNRALAFVELGAGRFAESRHAHERQSPRAR